MKVYCTYTRLWLSSEDLHNKILMMKIFEALLTGFYTFDPLITHQYHLSLPYMCKNMVMNTYKKDWFLSIRCSTVLSFKRNWKMTGCIQASSKKVTKFAFFFLYLDMPNYPDSISTFLSKIPGFLHLIFSGIQKHY